MEKRTKCAWEVARQTTESAAICLKRPNKRSETHLSICLDVVRNALEISDWNLVAASSSVRSGASIVCTEIQWCENNGLKYRWALQRSFSRNSIHNCYYTCKYPMSESSRSSGIPAGTIRRKRLINIDVFFRSKLYALLHSLWNRGKRSARLSIPWRPSTNAISGVKTKGALSRLMPNFDLKWSTFITFNKQLVNLDQLLSTLIKHL